MKRIFNKSKDHKQSEEWDVMQNISMTPEERQDAAKAIRERVFGKKSVDVRLSRSEK